MSSAERSDEMSSFQPADHSIACSLSEPEPKTAMSTSRTTNGDGTKNASPVQVEAKTPTIDLNGKDSPNEILKADSISNKSPERQCVVDQDYYVNPGSMKSLKNLSKIDPSVSSGRLGSVRPKSVMASNVSIRGGKSIKSKSTSLRRQKDGDNLSLSGFAMVTKSEGNDQPKRIPMVTTAIRKLQTSKAPFTPSPFGGSLTSSTEEYERMAWEVDASPSPTKQSISKSQQVKKQSFWKRHRRYVPVAIVLIMIGLLIIVIGVAIHIGSNKGESASTVKSTVIHNASTVLYEDNASTYFEDNVTYTYS